jgi:hypothetical protein
VSDKTYMQLEAELAAREAELAGMTKARDTFYNDMLLYKEAAEDLIEFRETLFCAIKKRDAQIKSLKISVQDREARADYSAGCAKRLSEQLVDRDARIAVLEEALNKAQETALHCVSRIRHGLGAGGHSTGMYVEVELGGVICDAITDAIEEEFEALSGKESAL